MKKQIVVKNSILQTLILTLALAAGSAQAQTGPGITNQPGSLSMKSGEIATFRVGATGEVALAYQWLKNGASLANTDRISGVNAAQLNIGPVVPQDAGSYSVQVVQDSTQVLSQSATLWVDLDLPVIVSQPAAQSLSAGGTAAFSCIATGSAPLAYWWRRDGVDLTNSSHFSGTGTAHLTIGDVTAADTGWYSLAVSNAEGVMSSRPARLTAHTASDYAVALDFDSGAWTSGGSAPWYSQSAYTHDGVSAARSGAIGYSQVSWLETTVYGPGDLSFYWMVSSEHGYDPLVFQVDGVDWAYIPGSVDWTPLSYHLSTGPHRLRWEFRPDYDISQGLNSGLLDQVSFTPTVLTSLELALNSSPLPLRSYGDAPWFGQENTNHDGASAARSGYISHNQSSTVEADVTGPGTVSFWWKVSSEYSDPLIFLVDGVPWESIAQEVTWTNRTFHIPWGIHTLSWRYQKDYNNNIGADAAWLDQVSYTPVVLSTLTEASDLPSLLWTTDGDFPWFGENEFTHDGTDALQSGPITHNQSSGINSAVTGPGTLTFSWKVSSEYSDWLGFFIDGLEQERIANEVDWTQRTYVIRPGTHPLRWQYTKDYAINVGTDSGWLDQVTFHLAPAIPAALNCTNLVWSTSGGAAWFPEMVTSQDGTASVRSGDITHNQSCTLETSVRGPGTFSFYWKVSSEAAYDPVTFSVDGVEENRVSGEVDWTIVQIRLAAGTHTLSWAYQKDYTRSQGSDAAWLDGVSFAADPPQPTLVGSTKQGTNFNISAETVVGKTYILEYKDQLATNVAWIPLLPGVTGNGSTKLLIDPAATNATQRFYRVRVQ
jgi:hypothetical protein